MKSDRIPIESVRGVDTVTVWMWPDSPDPVQFDLSLRQWAKVERRAENVADGDIGRVFGAMIESELQDV
jgi:hypothetical protein